MAKHCKDFSGEPGTHFHPNIISFFPLHPVPPRKRYVLSSLVVHFEIIKKQEIVNFLSVAFP